MKRSLSKEHLTADSCQSPTTPQEQNQQNQQNQQYQFNIPANEQHIASPRTNTNQTHNQNPQIKSWQLILIMSSLFANGIAAASVYYLWQFCE